MARRRLDAELARRGLARSREQAQGLIDSGSVMVRGVVATKAATQVDPAEPIEVHEAQQDYVSRGAHKLIGALDAFPAVQVAGRDAMDAGASTGGFTQVLLERGANRVLAVDVGYGQLAWSVREDPRVVSLERTNVRYLTEEDVPWLSALVVADLSFISLATVLPALIRCSARRADFLLMVKPQFEVGRSLVGDGVIRDPAVRAGAVHAVAQAALTSGLGVRGVAASPLPGPRGNVEYFLWLHKDAESLDGDGLRLIAAGDLADAIADAVAKGPA